MDNLPQLPMPQPRPQPRSTPAPVRNPAPQPYPSWPKLDTRSMVRSTPAANRPDFRPVDPGAVFRREDPMPQSRFGDDAYSLAARAAAAAAQTATPSGFSRQPQINFPSSSFQQKNDYSRYPDPHAHIPVAPQPRVAPYMHPRVAPQMQPRVEPADALSGWKWGTPMPRP